MLSVFYIHLLSPYNCPLLNRHGYLYSLVEESGLGQEFKTPVLCIRYLSSVSTSSPGFSSLLLQVLGGTVMAPDTQVGDLD